MSSPFLRKYNTLLATATTAIRIPMIKAGSNDFAVAVDWTPAAGDVKVSINSGALANITNLPTYVNGAWEFILTAAELSSKTTTVTIVDSATKAVEDQFFSVETFGNASAMYQFDPQDAVRLGLTALPNAAADAVGGLPISDAGGLDMDGLAKDATVSKPGIAQTISSNADMTAIKAKTDNLPASPAAVGSEMLLTVAYDAAKTAATQASLDALDLVADAVKVKTDQLAFSAGAVQADLQQVAGSATVDGLSLVNMFKSLITFARGKIIKTGNAYAYRDQADATTVFTNTASLNDRTPS